MIFLRLYSQVRYRFDGITCLFHLLSKNSKALQDIPAEVRVKSSKSYQSVLCNVIRLLQNA